jgi:3-hydroxyisobutyrate dehydrogenase-like beta-hydroxyacid dehydrogenase
VRVGFVGVGRLGGHLAASLVRDGFDVIAYDRDPAALKRIAALGARAASSPGEAADEVEVVITCLPSPAISSEVVAGSDGVLSRLREGGTWIEMSTTDKHEVLRLAGLGEKRGLATLEAPVTGGVHLAATGEITVIVGGDAEVAAAHMPLFRSMGSQIFHVGPLGLASDLKVITNMLAFIHLVACGEALMLSKQAGLDLRQAWEVIAASSGTSFVHETEGQVILNGSYDIGFTMDLALKDLGLALRLGEETGVALDLASLTEATFEIARQRYGGSAFSPMVVRLLEDAVGAELRVPGFPEQL